MKEAYPDLEMDVVAEDFSPLTTSDGAAGFWQPHLDPFTPKDKVRTWSTETFRVCESLWWREAETALSRAVSLLPVSEFWTEDEDKKARNPGYKDIVYGYRSLTPAEIERQGQGRNMY